MADAQENSPDSSSDIDVADVDDENSSMLLFVNRFLPPVERDAVIGETKDSEEELLQALSNLNDEVAGLEEVSVKTVGRVIKLINSRIILKYYFSVSPSYYYTNLCKMPFLLCYIHSTPIVGFTSVHRYINAKLVPRKGQSVHCISHQIVECTNDHVKQKMGKIGTDLRLANFLG